MGIPFSITTGELRFGAHFSVFDARHEIRTVRCLSAVGIIFRTQRSQMSLHGVAVVRPIEIRFV